MCGNSGVLLRNNKMSAASSNLNPVCSNGSKISLASGGRRKKKIFKRSALSLQSDGKLSRTKIVPPRPLATMISSRYSLSLISDCLLGEAGRIRQVRRRESHSIPATSSSTPHVEAQHIDTSSCLHATDLSTCGRICGQTAPQVDSGITVLVFV